jgi:uncharacterized protein
MKIFSTIILIPIQLYRYAISPFFTPSCRFTPTCSEYMKDAVKLYGPLKGSMFCVKRICRCHPFGKSEFDPVPQKRFNHTHYKEQR